MADSGGMPQITQVRLLDVSDLRSVSDSIAVVAKHNTKIVYCTNEIKMSLKSNILIY